MSSAASDVYKRQHMHTHTHTHIQHTHTRAHTHTRTHARTHTHTHTFSNRDTSTLPLSRAIRTVVSELITGKELSEDTGALNSGTLRATGSLSWHSHLSAHYLHWLTSVWYLAPAISVSKHGASRPQKPYGLLGTGRRGERGHGGGRRGRLYTYRYTVTTRMIPALRLSLIHI